MQTLLQGDRNCLRFAHPAEATRNHGGTEACRPSSEARGRAGSQVDRLTWRFEVSLLNTEPWTLVQK